MSPDFVKKTFCCLLAAHVACSCFAATNSGAAKTSSNAPNMVAEAMTILQQRAVSCPTNDIQRRAIEAMIKAIDPRARLIKAGDTNFPPVWTAKATNDPQHVLLTNQIDYISIKELTPESATAVATAFAAADIAERRGIIFDLRDCHGTNLPCLAKIASYFAQPGDTLFSFRNRTTHDLDKVDAEIVSNCLWIPVIVIMNEKTTGNAEILAAVLKRVARKCALIGRPTDADPLIRERIPLSNGDQIYIATRELVVFNDTAYGPTNSINPEVIIEPPTSKKITLDRRLPEEMQTDTAISRAMDLLQAVYALKIEEPSDDFDSSGR